MIVAVEALGGGLVICGFGDRSGGLLGDVHSSDRKNCSNGHLGAHVHLNVPDEEDGHETQRPICNTGDSGIGVGRVDGEFWVNAGSCSAGVLRPEV